MQKQFGFRNKYLTYIETSRGNISDTIDKVDYTLGYRSISLQLLMNKP